MSALPAGAGLTPGCDEGFVPGALGFGPRVEGEPPGSADAGGGVSALAGTVPTPGTTGAGRAPALPVGSLAESGALGAAADMLDAAEGVRGASSDAPMMMSTAVPTTTHTPTSTRQTRSAMLGLPISENETREGCERGAGAVAGVKTW